MTEHTDDPRTCPMCCATRKIFVDTIFATHIVNSGQFQLVMFVDADGEANIASADSPEDVLAVMEEVTEKFRRRVAAGRN